MMRATLSASGTGQIELVFDGLAREHPARPQAQGVVMASAMVQRRGGAHDHKLAQVASTLNIGVDALVFLDDNPVVAVPELPDDPALFPRMLAAAGYLEAVGFSREDGERGELKSLGHNSSAIARLMFDPVSGREKLTTLEGSPRAASAWLSWGALTPAFIRDGPRKAILGVIEKPSRFGHSAVKYIADRKLIFDPGYIDADFNYVSDLSYLPFRQMRLLAADLLHRAIGLRKDFDPA